MPHQNRKIFQTIPVYSLLLIVCASLTGVALIYRDQKLIGCLAFLFTSGFALATLTIILGRIYGLELEESIAYAKRSEKSFREVYENVPIGIIKVNLKQQFIAANPAFQRMLGYTQGELL